MYRDRTQWTKIRRRILVDEIPIRQVVRETGIKPFVRCLPIAGPNHMDRDLQKTLSRSHAWHLLPEPIEQLS